MVEMQTVSRDAPVLIVDDSPAILALLRDMLRGRGYRNVMVAETSEEATKLLAEHKPELVFLDLMMPDTSGLEMTKRVLEANPHAHIVVTTALPPSHEAVVMAVSQGAEEYLPKPLRPENVDLVLSHITREHGPRDFIGYG